MPAGGESSSPYSTQFYSIQRTYIIKPLFYPDKLIFTCDERIDIPTIEPLTYVDPVVYPGHRPNVVPCIEIMSRHFDLDGINLTFETNEGVTVLPVKIASGEQNPLENPYLDNRYVLVLPRGTTGIKTCKITVPAIGKEFQHNFTFGIMPPPYNYDNALLGYLSCAVKDNSRAISNLDSSMSAAFSNLQQGLYQLESVISRFPLTSTPLPENRNLSLIRFDVKNNTGAKASLKLEFISRAKGDSSFRKSYSVPIADGDNSVIIDIDKGIITTISKSTAEPFMLLIAPKYKNHVITALNKASITGDTTEVSNSYSYFYKSYLGE